MSVFGGQKVYPVVCTEYKTRRHRSPTVSFGDRVNAALSLQEGLMQLDWGKLPVVKYKYMLMFCLWHNGPTSCFSSSVIIST
jgi:hypothetical protein